MRIVALSTALLLCTTVLLSFSAQANAPIGGSIVRAEQAPTKSDGSPGFQLAKGSRPCSG